MFEQAGIGTSEFMVLEYISMERPGALPPLTQSMATWLIASGLVTPPGDFWDATDRGRNLLTRPA